MQLPLLSRKGCLLNYFSLSDFFFFFFNPTCLWRSDDRTEETEAADWPVGTTCTHEHQPPAACISSWTERAQLTLTECERNLKR